MKMMHLMILLITLFSTTLIAQISVEESLDKAFQNAKKGIYWALGNIPDKKTQAENDLIEEDRLVSSVKLFKEVNGVKVESSGFSGSTEVRLTLFRSTEKLFLDGYLRPDTLANRKDTLIVKKANKKKAKNK
ncbi:MAG: hypothetical protein Q8858_12300 [Bacteroidota bacterium]|nr:hypothetical protein [Bacteroidota bacterium]